MIGVNLVSPTESDICGHAQRDIFLPVDIKTVRLAVGKAMDERGWTQEQLAERSGVRQSHISKIVRVGDDPDEFKDLAARVLFQIIERGFGLPLSSFFAQIEGLSTTARLTQDSRDGARDPVPPQTWPDVGLGPEARERLTELWLALGTIVAPPRRSAALDRPAPGDRAGVAGRTKSGRSVRRTSSG